MGFFPETQVLKDLSDDIREEKKGSPISRQVKKHERSNGNSSCSLFSTRVIRDLC
jgi:hypothetical protein